MGKLFEKGLLYLALAMAVVIATIVLAVIVIAGIATLLGNLAVWPLLGSMILGHPISLEMTFGIAALMAVIIFLGVKFLPEKTERFFDIFGAVLAIGVTAGLWLGIFGSFPWVLLKLMGLELPVWTIWPMGLGLFWLICNLPSKKAS